MVINVIKLCYNFSRLLQDHMKVSHELSEREVLRPGMTRLSFPYFMSQEAIDFVVKAVSMIAIHGWKLLPQVHNNSESTFSGCVLT